MSPMTVSVCLAVLLVTVEFGATNPSRQSDNDIVEEIIGNKIHRKDLISCVVHKNRCTPKFNEFNELKKILSEALTNCCANCSQKERRVATKAINTLMHYPDDYQRLGGVYRKMCSVRP